MPAQPSQTRICNNALVHLGSTARISAINEGSPLAKTFEAVWDEGRDEVLTDHPWNFAIIRAELAVSADFTPIGEQYLYAYEMPSDWLRWLPWRRDHIDHFEGEQEIGLVTVADSETPRQFILSNAEAPIIARGIRRIETISLWSPGFKAALAAKLAFKTAKAITGQGSMVDRMADVYLDELRRAKRQDGHATGERARSAHFRSTWLNSRENRDG